MPHDADLKHDEPLSSAEATGAPLAGSLTTIVLLRHGPVEDGGNCYGARVSPPLADAAPSRIAALKTRLPETFSQVVSSPATRCIETARLLGFKDTPTDAAWIERDFGDWEGRPWSSVWSELGDITDAEAFAALTPPNGEPWLGVQSRAATALDALVKSAAPGDAPIAVVTHGGVIRALLAHVLDISIGKSLLFDPAPASATWLTSWGDTWTVARVGG